MRRMLGAGTGAVTAAFGALILGEYPFSGVVVLLAAALVGLAVAEVVVVVGRWRGAAPAGVAAVVTGAGLVWAAWISETRDLGRLPLEGWLAVALGMAVAGLRGWRPGSTRDSPTAPVPRP